uniref:Uncharacterized protein n=1 Tax=Avena sativa TaxID=4498 RepID=A0ACD5XHD5_AVESA
MPAKRTVIDCTRGLSREERTIARRNRLESLISSGSHLRRRRRGWLDKEIEKSVKLRVELLALRDAKEAEYARVFKLEHPNQVPSSIPFQEEEFGYSDSPHQALQALRVTNDITEQLSQIVVALALFDGDKMLFACSGVAVPSGPPCKLVLTRFVTSRRLVDEFNKNRNLDDNLRADNVHMDGFLGLYDERIAIVTSCDCDGYVYPVDLDLRAPRPSDGNIIAAARSFKSARLMVTPGHLTVGGDVSWTQITEAALGGPLIDHDGMFLGVILHIDNGESPVFISPGVLGAFSDSHVDKYIVLYCSTEISDFRGYSLPPGVFSIVPSGFWRRIHRLMSAGYPMPPPLVLEFNGELLNSFYEEFGELRAWKEYPYKVTNPDSWEYVWGLLPRDVVTNISRSVVKLASFKGSVGSFACTGLLIKWPGTRGMRPVILTSASLVRSRDDHYDIDKNLTIDVFLPPGQNVKGTLIYYQLGINLAIVSLDKGIHGVRPVDLCRKEGLSKPVVAIGRQIKEGFLMATKGEVCGEPRLSSDYGMSTCKINKAGIGGPLINFDGAFAGMNHYDGKVACFLRRRKIVEILKREIKRRMQRGSTGMLHGVRPKEPIRKWTVPEPYWHHGELEVDLYELPPHIGRTLM